MAMSVPRSHNNFRMNPICTFCDDRIEESLDQVWFCDFCTAFFCSEYCIEETILWHSSVCTGLIKKRSIEMIDNKTAKATSVPCKSNGAKNTNSKTASVPCKFFSAGKCRSGDSCGFLHKSQENVCQFFQAGNCRFGNKCENLHSSAYPEPSFNFEEETVVKNTLPQFGKKRPVCYHFQKGKCDFGLTCYKQHIQPLPHPLQNFNNSPKVDVFHAKVDRPVIVNPAAVTNVPRVAVGGDTKNSGGKKLSPEDEKENEAEWETVPICVFFNRGACAYGDHCYKAHEKMPLYKKDWPPDMMIKRKKNKGEMNVTKDFESGVGCGGDDGGGGGYLDLKDKEETQYTNNNNQDKVQNKNVTGSKKTLGSSKPIAKKKTETKKTAMEIKNKLDNPFEVLQASGASSSEEYSDEESEEDDFFEEDEEEEEAAEGGNEEQEDEQQVEEEEILETVVKEEVKPQLDKKSKKMIKKQKKNENLRIIIDNLRYEGNRQMELGNYNKAMELYTSAISKSASSNLGSVDTLVLHNNRAEAYIKSGNYRLAFNDAKKCFDSDNDNVKAQYRLLVCCEMLGQIEVAKNVLNKIGNDFAKKEAFSTKFAVLARCQKGALNGLKKDKLTKAENSVDEALKICQKSNEFRVYKAVILALKENLKEADILMRSLDHKDPELKTGWYSFAQGILLYHENDLERSLSCLALAKRDVLKAELWHEKVSIIKFSLEKGRRNLAAGFFKSAVETLSNGMNLAMDNKLYKLDVFLERSYAYTKLGDLDAAIKDLTLALDVEEEEEQLWLRRAKVYIQMEEFPKALSDLEMAKKLNPTWDTNNLIKETKEKKRLKDIEQNSYYNVLGVEKTANQDIIRKEFMKKAKMFHPDKHANNAPAERKVLEEKMKEVSRAYKVLSDPDKRAEYDAKTFSMQGNCWDDDDGWEDMEDDFDLDDFYAFMRAMTGNARPGYFRDGWYF